MQERDTINILISQLLCKDDEILSLRSQLDGLRKDQQANHTLILQKLDSSLKEQQNMRKDYKALADRLSKSLKAESEAKNQIAILTQALEELKNTRAEELFELDKQKRQLYGRKSEKSSFLHKVREKDLKEDKDDFDGSNDPDSNSSLEDNNNTQCMNPSAEKPIEKAASKPIRSDYSKNATQVGDVVMHYCNRDHLPADARQIDLRHWVLYKPDWSVTKHLFEVLRLIDKESSISNYYESQDRADEMKPFEHVLPGYHVDMDMIAQIMVDKYQYSMSLERVVAPLQLRVICANNLCSIGLNLEQYGG